MRAMLRVMLATSGETGLRESVGPPGTSAGADRRLAVSPGRVSGRRSAVPSDSRSTPDPLASDAPDGRHLGGMAGSHAQRGRISKASEALL